MVELNLKNTLKFYNRTLSQDYFKTKQKPKINLRVRFIAGLLGSTISSTICSPLDLIKVRLQVGHINGIREYNGLVDAFRQIYIHEGISGFFKGTKVALVTLPIFYSLYFPIYEYSKLFYGKMLYNDPNKINIYVYSLASMTAGITCDIITNPLWVVRVRYQTEFLHSGKNKHETFNVIRMVRSLYRKEGFWALYRGLIASFFGLPHVVIQFNLYEHLKAEVAKLKNTHTDNIPLNWILITSIVSKMCASLCTYPHEVIRNSLQNERHYDQKQMNIFKMMKEIYQSRGLGGFYAGFGLNLIRILPSNAIMFISYEYLSRTLSKYL